MNRLARGLVWTLLGLQVFANLVGPFVDVRPFAWAPFHEHATYRIEAVVQGRALTPDQIRARYGLYTFFYDEARDRDWQTNHITHVFDVIARVEASYPPEARASGTVVYRVNGHREGAWRW